MVRQTASVNSTGPLVPLSLPVGTAEAAQATQNIGFTSNLNAGAAVGTTYPTSVTIYDSLGQTHLATVTFTKTAANTWGYSIGIPGSDYTGTAANTTGSLTFNSSGQLTAPTGNVPGVTFPGMADGAADLNFSFALYNGAGTPTITQTIAASQTNASPQDGFPSGIYQGFSVDASGTMTAQFSNGQSETVGQVAVATVANPEALTVVGSNNYLTTAASGQIIAGVAGTGSRGTITDSAPGAVERGHLDRVRESYRCSASVRGQLEDRDHIRYRDPGHDRNDPVGAGAEMDDKRAAAAGMGSDSDTGPPPHHLIAAEPAHISKHSTGTAAT